MATVLACFPTPIAVCVRRAPLLLYNFATGAWDTLPASGTPDANHLMVLTPTAKVGSFSTEQYGVISNAVANTPGAWVTLMTIGTNGLPTGVAGDIWSIQPCSTEPPPTVVNIGCVAQ